MQSDPVLRAEYIHHYIVGLGRKACERLREFLVFGTVSPTRIAEDKDVAGSRQTSINAYFVWTGGSTLGDRRDGEERE